MLVMFFITQQQNNRTISGHGNWGKSEHWLWTQCYIWMLTWMLKYSQDSPINTKQKNLEQNMGQQVLHLYLLCSLTAASNPKGGSHTSSSCQLPYSVMLKWNGQNHPPLPPLWIINYIKEEHVGLWSQLRSRMHLKKSNQSFTVIWKLQVKFFGLLKLLSRFSGDRPLKVCVLNKWLLNGCVDGQNRREKLNKWIWRRIKEQRWQYRGTLASAAIKLHQGGKRKRGCAPLHRVLWKMDGGWGGIKTEAGMQHFGCRRSVS